MSGLSAIGRSLRSVAGATLDRIRRLIPAPLGRAGVAGSNASAEEGRPDPRRQGGGDGGTLARQSTRRRSSTALEDPARFEDPADRGDEGADRGDPGELAPSEGEDGGDGVTSGPEPLDGLPVRDRSLTEPGEEETNDTRTEGERRPDGRFRIADPDNPDAYVEGDVSVALDHVR